MDEKRGELGIFHQQGQAKESPFDREVRRIQSNWDRLKALESAQAEDRHRRELLEDRLTAEWQYREALRGRVDEHERHIAELIPKELVQIQEDLAEARHILALSLSGCNTDSECVQQQKWAEGVLATSEGQAEAGTTANAKRRKGPQRRGDGSWHVDLLAYQGQRYVE